MFSFVLNLLFQVKDFQTEMILEGSNLRISANGYYAITIIALTLYLAFNLMLYFFMAFGLKLIYKKKGLDKTYLVWIPIVQVYALIRSFNYSKLFGIKKSAYATAMLVVSLLYYLNSIAVDIIYYSGDICRFIFKGYTEISIPKVPFGFEVVDYILYMAFTVGLIGTVIGFFKEKSPNSAIWLSILCVLISDLFPIFVFAFRKRETVLFNRYKVVYTNYGNYEKYKEQTKPKVEPFAEFNEKKADYSEPFAEFGEKEDTEKPFQEEKINQNTWESNQQPKENYEDKGVDIPEDNDDLFN